MGCSSVIATSYGEFSRRLHTRLNDRNLPLEGSMEITERCNLHCVHCYINRSASDRKALSRELSTNEFCDIINQIVDEGCFWLLFTGGEPFLRPDFLEIYMYAKRKGLLITLFTNGTLLTPEIVDKLAEHPPFSIEVSLYGATAETYEQVTGVPGSHSRCLRGIELLLAHDLPLKLKSPLMQANHHERQAMQEFAEKLGLEFRYDVELNLGIDGDKAPARQRLEPGQVVKLDLADTRREKEWHEFTEKFASAATQSEKIFQCGAGSGSFHIDARGCLSPCLMVRVPSFSLRHGTFRRGWTEFIPDVLDQTWTKQSPCNGCDMRALCSWCPGWAQLEHGDQQEPIEYLCHITGLRFKTLKMQQDKQLS
jgi:radical SAM protein with 4Fe4S-binding SPASM domain